MYVLPRKPHLAAEARDLAPLVLIHSNLCEMNEVLIKGGKKYFMTMIDDSTSFCYIYLLKSKDEALHYFHCRRKAHQCRSQGDLVPVPVTGTKWPALT
jgi:hypothetical protein